MAEAVDCCLSLWSLLLLALLPGGGGARLLEAFAIPGIGGAPPNGDGPGPPEVGAIIGADRSLVTAFLSGLPLVMSCRSALRPGGGLAGSAAPPGAPPGGGGGGGGGGPPRPGIGGGGGGGGGGGIVYRELV